MTFYQWLTLGLGALGFLGTWLFGAFTLGRAVGQIQASVKKYIDDELDQISIKLAALEDRFREDQRTQDHNFGEVGAALRQYMVDIEKKVREIEIYGRDTYVKIPDFKEAMDRLGDRFESAVNEIKEDMRRLFNGQK